MTAICLNHGVDILASFIAGTKRDHYGRILQGHTTIIFRERCLDEYSWGQPFEQFPDGINDDRNTFDSNGRVNLRERICSLSRYTLNRHLPGSNCLRERHCTPYYCWVW